MHSPFLSPPFSSFSALVLALMCNREPGRESSHESASQRGEETANTGEKRPLSNALELGPRKRPCVQF
jgi:hypothetical protein